MAPHDETFSTPRSATGFALAITLAVVTFWIAGLVVELYSYNADTTMQHAAATAVQTVSTPCPVGADEPVQCAPSPDDR